MPHRGGVDFEQPIQKGSNMCTGIIATFVSHELLMSSHRNCHGEASCDAWAFHSLCQWVTTECFTSWP